MKRAKLRGLKRNASVVLGTVGTEADIPVLAAAREDADSMVRSHSAWALARISSAIEATLAARED